MVCVRSARSHYGAKRCSHTALLSPPKPSSNQIRYPPSLSTHHNISFPLYPLIKNSHPQGPKQKYGFDTALWRNDTIQLIVNSLFLSLSFSISTHRSVCATHELILLCICMNQSHLTSALLITWITLPFYTHCNNGFINIFIGWSVARRVSAHIV